jgi:hypothetical protein
MRFEEIGIEGVSDEIGIERVGIKERFGRLVVKSKEEEENKKCDCTTGLLIIMVFSSNVVRSSISIRSLIN